MIEELAVPSRQSLLIELQQESAVLATGTGFFASSGPKLAFITNRHNVTGRDQNTGQPLSSHGGLPTRLCVKHNRVNHEGVPFETYLELFGESEAPLWVEHPTLGPRADVVAIPLQGLIDLPLFPYNPDSPGLEMILGPADSVSVIGFPFGLVPTGPHAVWATGFIATEPSLAYDGLPVFLIDCRTRKGQSGSPVIAYRSAGIARLKGGRSVSFTGPQSCFLGVYSGRIRGDSDIGMVWKASVVSDLLRAVP
jgi:hypothetical protein